MLDMMKLHAVLTAPRPSRGFDRCGDDILHNKIVKTISPVKNDYYSDQLPSIPAGVEIKIDFGHDGGFYGVAVINGVLNKVQVLLNELHLIDWSSVQEIIDTIDEYIANNTRD